MKEKYTQTKFFCKKGCGCKLCNPHKGEHNEKQLKIMSEEKEAPEVEGETQLEKGLKQKRTYRFDSCSCGYCICPYFKLVTNIIMSNSLKDENL